MDATHEDVFFYLDLTKEILKKKDIIKSIENYISEKKKVNIKGHYGLLIFQEQGNPIFITGKKDYDIITNAIDENWKNRPRTQSFFENGLFYIFSYIAEIVRKKSKYYRIIIITDTPSDLSEDYTSALFNLISKIKGFPTFIDIIRISEKNNRFFKDDVKLNILASDTKGSIFYVEDKKEFSLTLDKLLKMKQIVNIFTDKQTKVKINKEDYRFYSQLAKNLIPSPKDVPGIKCFFCNDEICPVCADINDIPLRCSNCGVSFHKCCITNYTIEHNIGIPHIFRCPNCDILTKINQDEIVLPEDPTIKSADEYIEEEFREDTVSYMDIYKESLDNTLNQDLEQTENKIFPINDDLYSGRNDNEEKTVRIGGFFGKLYTVKKEGDKIIYQRSSQSQENLAENYSPSNYKEKKIWRPANYDKPNFYICPVCGHQINEKERYESCPSCGVKF
jgi:rubrerythrin